MGGEGVGNGRGYGRARGRVGKGEGREKREGTPRVGSHPHVRNPEKYLELYDNTRYNKSIIKQT